MGHMNVMWYTGKFDEATWALFSLVGIGRSYLKDQQRGMAAVQQNTSYKREVEVGSVVVIRSSVLEVREKVLRFSHEMLDAETQQVVATSELTGVHFDRTTRKSCAFPSAIAERAKALIAP
jgi:acyl-CoA thioester hydrolase